MGFDENGNEEYIWDTEWVWYDFPVSGGCAALEYSYEVKPLEVPNDVWNSLKAAVNKKLTIYSEVEFWVKPLPYDPNSNCVQSDFQQVQQIETQAISAINVLVKGFDNRVLNTIPLKKYENDNWISTFEHYNFHFYPLLLTNFENEAASILLDYSQIDVSKTLASLDFYSREPENKYLHFEFEVLYDNNPDFESEINSFLVGDAIVFDDWLDQEYPGDYFFLPSYTSASNVRFSELTRSCISIDPHLDPKNPVLLKPEFDDFDPEALFQSVVFGFDEDYFNHLAEIAFEPHEFFTNTMGFFNLVREFHQGEDNDQYNLYSFLVKNRHLRFYLDLSPMKLDFDKPGTNLPTCGDVGQKRTTYVRIMDKDTPRIPEGGLAYARLRQSWEEEGLIEIPSFRMPIGTPSILAHELGHTIGGLNDEYDYYSLIYRLQRVLTTQKN